MFAQLPSLATVKSSLYRANLPPMPKSHSELSLSGEWAATLNGENFLFVDDGEHDKIVIFGTQLFLCHLAEASTFFVDGTFSVCPLIFYQVFTIHIMKYGQTFPMIYPLLLNKQRQTYSRAFLLLKDAAMNNGLTLDPETPLCDFELAIVQASPLNFPKATH